MKLQMFPNSPWGEVVFTSGEHTFFDTPGILGWIGDDLTKPTHNYSRYLSFFENGYTITVDYLKWMREDEEDESLGAY